MIVFESTKVTFVARPGPTWTVEAGMKPVPKIVKKAPPADGPDEGLILEIVGAGIGVGVRVGVPTVGIGEGVCVGVDVIAAVTVIVGVGVGVKVAV